jgi:hypothetical protein
MRTDLGHELSELIAVESFACRNPNGPGFRFIAPFLAKARVTANIVEEA